MTAPAWELELREIFREKDFRKAHERAWPVLRAMAADDSTLFDCLSKNIRAQGFLDSARINPVLALPMLETPEFTLVANCWIPRPDGNTELSHQSIHHHGNLLLSTVCAFGEGYDSLLFKKLEAQLPLVLLREYRNPRGNLEFVDSFTPHVVFYPAAVSVTYALWSRETPRRGAGLSSLVPLQKFRRPLKRAASVLGLKRFLDLNQERDLDYTVRSGQIQPLRERRQYQPGGRQNFLQALHFFARAISYSDPEGLERLSRAQQQPCWRNEFEAHHLFIPDVNLGKKEILACLR